MSYCTAQEVVCVLTVLVFVNSQHILAVFISPDLNFARTTLIDPHRLSVIYRLWFSYSKQIPGRMWSMQAMVVLSCKHFTATGGGATGV
jgi:hypothetical protein